MLHWLFSQDCPVPTEHITLSCLPPFFIIDALQGLHGGQHVPLSMSTNPMENEGRCKAVRFDGRRDKNVTFLKELRSLCLRILTPSTWTCARSAQMIPPAPAFKPEQPGYSARVRCPQLPNGHECRVPTSPNEMTKRAGVSGLNYDININILKSFVQWCAPLTSSLHQ